MLNIKKDGAYQDPEAVRRKEDGAWVEAEAVKRKEDGAWQEVWTGELVLDIIASTITTGTGGGSSWEGGYTFITTRTDGGAATFAVEKEFYNPTLFLLYELFCSYNGTMVPGGSIYAYGVKADGTEEVVKIVDNKLTESQQAASYTFTGGAYSKVGLRFEYANWGDISPVTYVGVVSQVTIDGKKCTFDPDDSFNFN